MRTLMILSVLVLPCSSAFAYDGFSPLSGPNTAIPSPVCDVINFGFCPQPPSPAVPVYDPDEVAVRPAPLPPPPVVARHGRARHHLRRD